MVRVGPFMSSYYPDHLCRHTWSGRTTYVPGPNILLQYIKSKGEMEKADIRPGTIPQEGNCI